MERWHVEALDPTDRRTAARVLEIQQAAYAVESDLIDFDEIPGRTETIEDVVASSDRLDWLGVRSRGLIVAAMATSIQGGTCDIDRLVVDPSWFRRGLARALLEALPADLTVTVATGSANQPGIALYRSMGFRVHSTVEIEPGLEISRLARPAVGPPAAPEPAERPAAAPDPDDGTPAVSSQ